MNRDRRSEDEDPVPKGRILRQRAMGTDALYRVIKPVEHGLQVEVIEAPGLQPGAGFVFSEEAIAAMEVLYAKADRARLDAKPAVPRRRLV